MFIIAAMNSFSQEKVVFNGKTKTVVDSFVSKFTSEKDTIVFYFDAYYLSRDTVEFYFEKVESLNFQLVSDFRRSIFIYKNLVLITNVISPLIEFKYLNFMDIRRKRAIFLKKYLRINEAYDSVESLINGIGAEKHSGILDGEPTYIFTCKGGNIIKVISQ